MIKITSIFKTILYKLKTNFLFRSIARKTIYKYPHIIHWKKYNINFNRRNSQYGSKKNTHRTNR